jgi:hypothetical protein
MLQKLIETINELETSHKSLIMGMAMMHKLMSTNTSKLVDKITSLSESDFSELLNNCMNFDLNKEDPMQHLLITLKDEPTGNDTQ